MTGLALTAAASSPTYPTTATATPAQNPTTAPPLPLTAAHQLGAHAVPQTPDPAAWPAAPAAPPRSGGVLPAPAAAA